MPEVSGWQQALNNWLEPFLDVLSHKTRCRWAAVYLRGLFGRRERKSVQPMAADLVPDDYDQLHNFLASPAWNTAPLEEVLVAKADALVGGEEALLVIDDTALPKKGKHSVGVAHQYAGVLGKQANCQVLVSLTLANRDVPVPLAVRLFLPESWTRDPERCRRAGVPDACRVARTKPEIALAELDRLRALGVRFSHVVADAGYGLSAPFRHGLSDRGLLWAVGIPCTQTVYTLEVQVTWPVAKTGRPRKRAVASDPKGSASKTPVSAAAILKTAAWHPVTWRTGTKGPLTAEFAAQRVRVADGPPQRDGTHRPGAELWLIGEHRNTGEYKYYLSNLPPDTALTALAALIKARWVCEQRHQQMKEELGLDHFEGRSWHGLHHHVVLVMIAFAFLQHFRLAQAPERKKNWKWRLRSAAGTLPASDPTRHSRAHRQSRPTPMSLLSVLAG